MIRPLDLGGLNHRRQVGSTCQAKERFGRDAPKADALCSLWVLSFVTLSGHSPALGRHTQKYPIELARAEEIDEGELPDHQASGGQKQTALAMIDLNYSAQPMKPIHVYFLNVRPRYKERIVRPSNVQAGTINPRLSLRSVRFQTKLIPDVEEYLISKHRTPRWSRLTLMYAATKFAT